MRTALLLASWLVLVGAAAAQEGPPKPEPKKPEPKKPETHKVARGTLKPTIESVGTFVPAGGHEIKLKPEAYQGDLKIAEIVAHGATAKKGETLLRIDAKPLERQVEAAEVDLRAAEAASTKAREDARLGAMADALARKQSELALAKAGHALEWWKSVERQHAKTRADLVLQASQDSVDDQQDELTELEKMYKSEELTDMTKDIVIKRAKRSLDRSRRFLAIAKDTHKNAHDHDIPNTELDRGYAAEKARLDLAQLDVTQALAKVNREAEVARARANVEKQTDKLADLRRDLAALRVASPADGTVFYGSLHEGAWQGGDLKALRAGEKVQAGTVLMTVFTPGELAVAVDVPERDLFSVEADRRGTVTPVSLPDVALEGRCRAPARVGRSKDAKLSFECRIELGPADARLSPGMKAKVKIPLGEIRDALLVPPAAIHDGQVWVLRDGQATAREVTLGRSDGKMTEVKSGLAEGEEVLPHGPPGPEGKK
ncbi:MAG: hypothetical protein L0216_19475 [Planctomycetales bacterium]|nr:hypothetical protein [Planctomycetales bacterium]